jgi:hypothetical protein
VVARECREPHEPLGTVFAERACHEVELAALGRGAAEAHAGLISGELADMVAQWLRPAERDAFTPRATACRPQPDRPSRRMLPCGRRT